MRLARLTSLMFVILLGAGSAYAQGTEVPFGTLERDPAQPVEISADTLSIDQTDGSAIFEGNVVVGQGELRISAGKIQVEYVSAEAGGSGQISRILASGGVVFVAGEESAQAETAEYQLDTGLIVMEGNVILSQGANAISAEKMTFNLESGRALLEGRVRTILQTGAGE